MICGTDVAVDEKSREEEEQGFQEASPPGSEDADLSREDISDTERQRSEDQTGELHLCGCDDSPLNVNVITMSNMTCFLLTVHAEEVPIHYNIF